MQFPTPLVRAILHRRYKRFLSDHELADGTIITAHCANPGSMHGLTDPGAETWLSRADNPKRKLAYTWELIRVGRGLVGINAAFANRLAEEAIAASRIAPLAGYGACRREVRYDAGSRIDLLLEDPARPPCYVEVKNVHLRRQPGLAEFPDSVTARGTKHLAALANMVEREGARAVMLYVVQRDDCNRFALAADIDPTYAEAFAAAAARGVEVLCYACALTPQSVAIADPLPIAIRGTGSP